MCLPTYLPQASLLAKKKKDKKPLLQKPNIPRLPCFLSFRSVPRPQLIFTHTYTHTRPSIQQGYMLDMQLMIIFIFNPPNKFNGNSLPVENIIPSLLSNRR